ncbi:MAG TPA: ParB/RepB/Spo0J family partition protein, partial [Candidatus Paceibacterota bacterium]|nr:ParB/RepB/Spo0J family partition protein [Candidatus Paceibacterota bacterium]
MSQFYNNAIFWVEVDKIKPNPFQPRKEFDEGKLQDLANSIRQYGVIQPLTVTRHEIQKEDGGLASEYELIAGERRLRAAKIAGIVQVPVLIRDSYDDDKTKLELAIIENLQREDLNPIDRALAFHKLVKDFGFKHSEVATKVGKSREYVSNTIRLLSLPSEMQIALADGKISEGHSRPLLMLVDRPQEQQTLFREILLKRLTVRDTESIARRIAF